VVTPIAEAGVFLVVNTSLHVNSVQELVALVKSQPGKLNVSAPTGTPHHLAAERIAALNNLQWARVSYRDPQQAVIELVAGLVPIAFSTWPSIAPHVQSGKLKLLADSTATRFDSLPNVPALAESYPGFEESAWFAIFSNAGNTGVIAPLAEYPEEVFDQVLAVHLRGAFLLCKYGLGAMRDGGSIVITSSVAGVRGDAGVYGYIAAKHAQVGLMRAVAKEAAARRIRVNTVHPGPVDNGFQDRIESELSKVLRRDATEFFNQLIPLQRHAQLAEIVEAVLYLASDQSSFTTGSALMVDGGMSA
jgi:NAD(P)-dependent dehydrogenase (short-subunit alcohol dehydrogenase family)